MQSEVEKACLAWVVDRAPIQLVWSYKLSEAACQAAAEGRVDVLTYLEKHGWVDDTDDDFQHWVPGIQHSKAAAAGGQIAALEWLSARVALDDASICNAAANANQLEALRWLQTSCNPPCPCDQETMSAAAWHGHLDILKYLRSLDPPCPWSAHVCRSAVQFPECLKWLRRQGCPWDGTCFRAAASAGRLSLLQWMRAEDPLCPMDTSQAMRDAASNNHFEVMQWLHAQDPQVHWGDETLSAVQHGNFAMLRWLRQQTPPCPWSGCCLTCAAMCEDKESLELMQLMLRDQCPWRSGHTATSARRGNMATLQWLHSAGYSLSSLCLESAARAGHTRLLGWLLSIGLRPDAAHPLFYRRWPIPALMLWGDHHLPLSDDLRQQLMLARATFCTLHGLIRWHRKQLAAGNTVSHPGWDSSYPFSSHTSSGQQLLTQLARLPPEILIKIATAADLQHDQPVPASVSTA